MRQRRAATPPLAPRSCSHSGIAYSRPQVAAQDNTMAPVSQGADPSEDRKGHSHSDTQKGARAASGRSGPEHVCCLHGVLRWRKPMVI